MSEITDESLRWADYPDDYDDRCEFDEDECDEPCGSCDECEGNLYEDDVYFDKQGLQFCGQCWWYLTGGTG